MSVYWLAMTSLRYLFLSMQLSSKNVSPVSTQPPSGSIALGKSLAVCAWPAWLLPPAPSGTNKWITIPADWVCTVASLLCANARSFGSCASWTR